MDDDWSASLSAPATSSESDDDVFTSADTIESTNSFTTEETADPNDGSNSEEKIAETLAAQLLKTNHTKRSSRRSAGLFPTPRSLQNTRPPQAAGSRIEPPPATVSTGNGGHAPSSVPGGFDVSPHASAAGQAIHNRSSRPVQNHGNLPDRSMNARGAGHARGAGQARGLAGSAIDKGIRLAQKISPMSTKTNENASDGHVEDVYLAVMGVTGAGKSSFIKLCTDQNVVIGHNLKSCTAFVEDFQIMYNDRIRLHLIDTPGFDDTHKSDTDVLRDIAAWLGTTYSNGILLSGILYLHRISDPRMGGGAMRNLHMFKELCGKDCFQSVLLATTFWNSIDGRKAIEHENELKTSEDFWGEMIDLGSSYTRHTGDKKSAWRILDFMIQRRHPFLATIQQEMVDGKLDLNETKAGRQLNTDLIALEEKHIKDLRGLEESYAVAQEMQNQRSMKRIAEMQEQAQKEIEEGKESQADLMASLEQINKERSEELEEYKSSIENRMKEMADLRRQLDEYQDGSKDAAKRNEQYQKQVRELQENLAIVKRRQPDRLDRIVSWLDETLNRLGGWIKLGTAATIAFQNFN